MADVKSLTEKKQVVDLLNRIADGISRQLTKSEKDLERFVRVMSDAERDTDDLHREGKPKATLLQLLGYTLASCDDHPYFMTIIGHTRYSPDYILSSGQKALAILDLKAPGISLDDREGIEQVQSYCARGDKASPLGVLFNGRSIRVFVNPDYPGFTRYKKLSKEEDKKKRINLYEIPVEAADNDVNAVAAVLLKLSVASLSDNPASVARKMANARIGSIWATTRGHEVHDRLRSALNEPSDEVIRAIASVDSLWEGMPKSPEPAEAIIAWNRRTEAPITVASVKAAAKQSINGLLRQTVAEACATRGWADVESRRVRGLRHRGVGGNGYHLVPQGEGVPKDLYVAGVATADADLIISQLKHIIKQ